MISFFTLCRFFKRLIILISLCHKIKLVKKVSRNKRTATMIGLEPTRRDHWVEKTKQYSTKKSLGRNQSEAELITLKPYVSLLDVVVLNNYSIWNKIYVCFMLLILLLYSTSPRCWLDDVYWGLAITSIQKRNC